MDIEKNELDLVDVRQVVSILESKRLMNTYYREAGSNRSG